MKEVNQLLLDLKRKIYKPVYFLSGEEPHYIDVISDYIESNVLEDGEKEFNQSVVYGKDVDLAAVIGLAKQFPMMSNHTVVIVKEAQNIKELNKSAGAEEEEDTQKNSNNSSSQLFLNYILNPQPSTILVFCYKYKKLDKRSALAKAIQKHSVYLETKKLYDNQVPDWITGYLKDKGYTINTRATHLIAESLGNDLSKVANELDKLLINWPANKEISVDTVQENIGISKDFNVFELQDALAKKDIVKANRIILHFAGNEKENPAPKVLASLYAYFSKLLQYHFLSDKSKMAVAGALGINPFFADGYAKAAYNYNSGKLKQIFSYLKEYDLKSKGVNNASVPYGELMKELVFKILH